jgi:hypothetical protein
MFSVSSTIINSRLTNVSNSEIFSKGNSVPNDIINSFENSVT